MLHFRRLPTDFTDRFVSRLSDDERDAVLDSANRTADTSFGPLLLAATTDGLARVAFDREDHEAVLATPSGGTADGSSRCGIALGAAVRDGAKVVQDSSAEAADEAATGEVLLELAVLRHDGIAA